MLTTRHGLFTILCNGCAYMIRIIRTLSECKEISLPCSQQLFSPNNMYTHGRHTQYGGLSTFHTTAAMDIYTGKAGVCGGVLCVQEMVDQPTMEHDHTPPPNTQDEIRDSNRQRSIKSIEARV